MNIAIFGGSFDPVHSGHIEVVKKALEMGIDKIIVIPNFLNPLKNKTSAPAELRYKWLKEVFNDFENIEVSDFEINQKRAVYSIETINHFKPKYFIIGSDNLKTLHKWKDIDEILNKVELIVAKRGDIDKNLLKKWDIKKVVNVNIPISSTEIRNGKFKYLPKKIENKIKEYYGKN